MSNEFTLHVQLDTKAIAKEINKAAMRFRTAIADGKPLPIFAGIDWAIDAFDDEQEMRARNLMCVAPLPCERE